jgi:hypothetical protein
VARSIQDDKAAARGQQIADAAAVFLGRTIERESELAAQFSRGLGQRATVARHPEYSLKLLRRLARETRCDGAAREQRAGAIGESGVQILQVARKSGGRQFRRLALPSPEPTLQQPPGGEPVGGGVDEIPAPQQLRESTFLQQDRDHLHAGPRLVEENGLPPFP